MRNKDSTKVQPYEIFIVTEVRIFLQNLEFTITYYSRSGRAYSQFHRSNDEFFRQYEFVSTLLVTLHGYFFSFASFASRMINLDAIFTLVQWTRIIYSRSGQLYIIYMRQEKSRLPCWIKSTYVQYYMYINIQAENFFRSRLLKNRELSTTNGMFGESPKYTRIS